MKIFLVYSKGFRKTGGLLAKALGILHGLVPPDYVDVLIRWCSVKEFPNTSAGRIINPIPALWNSRDKILMRKLFDEHGVHIPPWQIEPPEFTPQNPWPWIARTPSHNQGTGLRLCKNQNDIEDAKAAGIDGYYVLYIEPAREFGAHIFGDRVLCVLEKEIEYTFTDSGAILSRLISTHIVEHPDQRVIDTSLQAMEATKLDMGRVDLLESVDADIWGLETNSAPGLDPAGPAFPLYVDAFKKELGL